MICLFVVVIVVWISFMCGLRFALEIEIFIPRLKCWNMEKGDRLLNCESDDRGKGHATTCTWWISGVWDIIEQTTERHELATLQWFLRRHPRIIPPYNLDPHLCADVTIIWYFLTQTNKWSIICSHCSLISRDTYTSIHNY